MHFGVLFFAFCDFTFFCIFWCLGRSLYLAERSRCTGPIQVPDWDKINSRVRSCKSHIGFVTIDKKCSTKALSQERTPAKMSHVCREPKVFSTDVNFILTIVFLSNVWLIAGLIHAGVYGNTNINLAFPQLLQKGFANALRQPRRASDFRCLEIKP